MFKLVIVGRPNVGKSALFNRICQKRLSIVDQEEGVTRDRLYAQAEYFGFNFEVIDTGGVDPRSCDAFMDEIRRQASIAVDEADALIMVVDATTGITALDKEIAILMLKTQKPITLAVNKVDEPSQKDKIHAFYSLGITHIVATSATQGYQIAELLECAWREVDIICPNKQKTLCPDTKSSVSIHLSIIGRPNVGKSTLINALLEEKRCVVSSIAGTTRDSVDIPFVFQDQAYTLIDTAGIKRKKSERIVVEKFARMRTERAIERSDVSLLMLDAVEGLTTQEKRIANMIEKAGKGCVIVLNKWDLVKGFCMQKCARLLREQSHFLEHCPILFISAKQKTHLHQIFQEVNRVYQATQMRITTHQLNKFIERALQLNHPPVLTGKRLRIYYMTQVDVHPPRFVLFVNRPNLMAEVYKKYLINSFRKQFPFVGTPLQLFLKGKKNTLNTSLKR